MTKAVHFLPFTEDGRTSMEVYASNLGQALREKGAQDLELHQYRPGLGGWTERLTENANLRMRAARYIDYPRQVRAQQGDVNHILDHGYAHLLSKLDPARTVVTVHDIIPILAGRGLIPGVRRPRRGWLSEWTARYYRKAARIIAISESTRNDLVAYCGCDPERIAVVYYGLDEAFQPLPDRDKTTMRSKLGLPADARLVLITGQEFYKNQTTSLRVMERLQSSDDKSVRLVRLGRLTPEWTETLVRSPFREQVIQIDYLPKDDMPSLYNAVDCLLFPSWYEGFGWPPVEAMACGTPAVTSNAASLPEAVGKAGLTAAPDDVEGLAAHVARLLDDSVFRAEQIDKGLQHAKQFDWSENAARTRQLYEEIGSNLKLQT